MKAYIEGHIWYSISKIKNGLIRVKGCWPSLRSNLHRNQESLNVFLTCSAIESRVRVSVTEINETNCTRWPGVFTKRCEEASILFLMHVLFCCFLSSAQRKLSKHDSTVLKQMTYQRLPESAQLQSCGVAAIQSPEQLALQVHYSCSFTFYKAYKSFSDEEVQTLFSNG